MTTDLITTKFGTIAYCRTGDTLQWRHNERDGIPGHQPHGCLRYRLFRYRSKKTSKLRVTGLCAANSPVTGEFPAHKASNAENVSVWWRHHILHAASLTINGFGKIHIDIWMWCCRYTGGYCYNCWRELLWEPAWSSTSTASWKIPKKSWVSHAMVENHSALVVKRSKGPISKSHKCGRSYRPVANQRGTRTDRQKCYMLLAATKQLYDWFSPSARLSVRPSHLFHHVPIIVSSWNFQELLPWIEVMSMQKVKVRGQRSRSQRSTPNLAVSGL